MSGCFFAETMSFFVWCLGSLEQVVCTGFITYCCARETMFNHHTRTTLLSVVPHNPGPAQTAAKHPRPSYSSDNPVYH